MSLIISMDQNKPLVEVVMLGSRNSGKTTLMGYLFYALANIDKGEIERWKSSDIMCGDLSPFDYRRVMEIVPKNSVSIIDPMEEPTDILITPKFQIRLLDGENYLNFVEHLIVGPRQMNCSLLTVSAAQNDFSIIQTVTESQLKSCALRYTLGSEPMIVTITKMDATTPAYSQSRFEQIKHQMTNELKSLGFQTDRLLFIPISVNEEENIVDPTTKMPWYQGWSFRASESVISGKSLVNALDYIQLKPSESGKPLRLPIQSWFKIPDFGLLGSGRIRAGTLNSTTRLIIAPDQIPAEVKSIEKYNESVNEGTRGDFIGLSITGPDFKQLRRGQVVADANNNPARGAVSFTAQLQMISHSRMKITKNDIVTVDIHSASIPCKVLSIKPVVNDQTNCSVPSEIEYLTDEGDGTIEFEPMKPLSVEKFSDYPQMGRFIILYQQKLGAVGVIKEVIHQI